MPVRNENRFAFSRRNLVAVADAVAAALREWPAGWDEPSPQQLEALGTASAKMESQRAARQPFVSLKRAEREALWWLSCAARSALGPEAPPWELLDAMLWTDG